MILRPLRQSLSLRGGLFCANGLFRAAHSHNPTQLPEYMQNRKTHHFDANGLFRATHSHNPTQYSHIMRLVS